MKTQIALMIVLLYAADAVASSCPAAVTRTDAEVHFAEMNLAAPNDEYTGDDIQAAIGQCGSTANCTVMLREATYTDVEVLIDDSVGNGFRIDCETPRACVLQHTIGFAAAAVRVASRKSGIQLANFACDGRKMEQPGTSDPGQSRCVEVANGYAWSADDGWVDNIHAHDLKDGVLIRNGAGWAVTNSLFERMGCNEYEEPCSEDWNALDSEHESVPFTSVPGFGINVRAIDSEAVGPDDTCIEGNEVVSATKVGIGIWSNEGWGASARIYGGVIRGNRVERAGQTGISVAKNVQDIEIRDNHVVHSGGYFGNSEFQGKGIACGGSGTGGIELIDNSISGTWYRGIDTDATCASTISGNLVRGECMGPGCVAEDSDSDGVADYFDNCRYIANGPNDSSNQVDSDGDGFGNACDYDFMQYGKLPTTSEWNTNLFWLQYAIEQPIVPTQAWASMDMNGDATIDNADKFIASVGHYYHFTGGEMIMVSGLEGDEIGDCADPYLRTGTSFPWYPVGIDDPCPARTPWWE